VRTGGALAALAVSLIPAASAGADTYVVTTTNDPPLELCDRQSCSLRDAIDAANAHPGPDRVLLPEAARYQLRQLGPDEGNAHGDLDVLDGTLTVQHKGAGRATIDNNPPRDGFPDPFDRIFEVHNLASLTLKGIVVTDGGDPSGSPNGGGILASDDLTLIDSVVTGNEAPGSGGGIASGPGDAVSLRRSVVSDNVAQVDGGGIVQISAGGAVPGNLSISRSTIARNRALIGDGGGVFFKTGNVDDSAIVDSTFARNRAGDDGGGIYADLGLLTVNRVTVSHNRAAGTGGGLQVNGANRMDVLNSTFAANRANGFGGGIHAATDVNVNAITVARNVADADGDSDGSSRAVLFTAGGGLFAGSGADFGVENSLIALNTRGVNNPDDCAGDEGFDSRGQNLVSTEFNCGGFVDPTDIEEQQPRIGELGDYGGFTETVPLRRGSAAIGEADPATAPSVDQRRLERRNPDIGAFELVEDAPAR
jgi:CSLREA domain-containing protein